MAFWKSLLGYVSGAAYRQPGVQNGRPGSYSGDPAVPVTLDTSLQLSAVWSCTKLITESMGSLPIVMYKKQADGSLVVETEHNLARLLMAKVNRWQTRQEYVESLTYQNVLLGNDYSAVQRNTKGDIIALVPLMSEQMEVKLEDNGDITYRYQSKNELKVYSDVTVWHNKLFGNGIIGLSPLDYARNSIGIGLAAEEGVKKIYRNGGKPSGVLTIDKVVGKEQRKAIRESYAELTEGKQDRLFVLEAGMQYHQVSLSPQDIEMLASRRFQIEDICRFFGVPSVLVNDTEGSTVWGSGIEQIVIGFYKFGLAPRIKRMEQSMNVRLLTIEERGKYILAFDVRELLEPSQSERVKTSKEGVTGGILTPNEARKTIGLKPLPGGDSLYLQQQMIPVEQLKDLPRGSIKDEPQKPNQD